MELTDRKKRILRAIVDSYIRTAEPVGSKAIAAMPDMSFSSATIRNEMAELTNMGLLEQPHTSAGRIPSPAGYRLYIDELMQDYSLSIDETQSLNQAMQMRLQEFDTAMAQVGKLVSKLTNLPAYAMTSRSGAATVKRFEIIMAETHSFILVVMTSGDVVKNKLIKLPLNVTEQDLKLLSAVLNASLTELPLEEITPELLNRISRSAGVTQVTFTGGEPTMRDDLFELIDYARWFVTRVNTNGIKLTPEYCDRLRKASVDSVQITFYSSDEAVHNELVGAPHYAETVAGIENALAAGISLSVNTPLCTLNRDYVKTLEFLREKGVIYVTCSGLITTGNATKPESEQLQLSADELKQILREAVSYCHVRGVQVHLTLNTLASDRELPKVAEVIRTAARRGVDAFIVQDFGIVSLCRQIAPHIPVHASTQMSVHSLEGVEQAAAMGISRVVLARELPKEDIAYICKHSPVEIEVFVHGALCMSYSGQCYLSGVIGTRSGNRGQCAQPCRLPYGYGRFEDKYPLSLKDNCLIDYLRELERMGVASLKIEGRAKRPEYVATAVRVYRNALDTGMVTKEDARDLQNIFSRQGFTDGYYRSRTGPAMFGTRQDTREDRALRHLPGIALIGEKRVQLSPAEEKIFSLLLEKRGETVPLEALLEALPESHAKTNVLQVHMYRLRRKLSTDGISYIRAIRGVGYRLA